MQNIDFLIYVFQEQILEDVEKVCKIIPSANISALCDKYVKEYGPFAVDLLLTSKPEVLCSFAKLCGTGETVGPMFMVPIPEDPVKETGIFLHNFSFLFLCKFVIKVW